MAEKLPVSKNQIIHEIAKLFTEVNYDTYLETWRDGKKRGCTTHEIHLNMLNRYLESVDILNEEWENRYIPDDT